MDRSERPPRGCNPLWLSISLDFHALVRRKKNEGGWQWVIAAGCSGYGLTTG